MSVKAISWAYEAPAELDVYEAFILVTLADQADDYGVCWALNRTLQAKCRCGARKVTMALQRLQALGLILQVHRRRANGSQRSSAFILIGWPDRMLVDRIDDHPTLQQLHVEGVEDITTIRVHVVRSAGGVDKAVDKPVEKPDTDRTACGTPPHDMRDPPARRAPLEPSNRTKKRTYPLTPSDQDRLESTAKLIRQGRPYLCQSITAHVARQCLAAELVTIDQIRASRISI